MRTDVFWLKRPCCRARPGGLAGIFLGPLAAAQVLCMEADASAWAASARMAQAWQHYAAAVEQTLWREWSVFLAQRKPSEAEAWAKDKMQRPTRKETR